MRAALVVLAVAAAAVAVPLQWLELEKAQTITKGSRLGDIYTLCNKSGDPFVFDVTIKPDPPVKGQDLAVSLSYTLKEEVTGGDAKLSVKLDGFPVFNKDMRLCDLLSQERVSCPVKPFSGFNSTTVTLPDVGGHVTGSARVTDQNGKELACVDFDFHL